MRESANNRKGLTDQPATALDAADHGARLTILLHLYYPGSWDMINAKCGQVIKSASRIIVTVCHDDVMQEVGAQANLTILKVPNRGKDIGGKLAGLAYYINFCRKTDYLILLHDKISPQTINASYWLEKLYSIFEKDLFDKAMKVFDKSRHVGIIGSKAFLKNEYTKSGNVFATTNNDILQRLMREYGLSCRRYDFIAGTIFIARSRIYEDFFSDHSPIEARKRLESGNVLDLEEGTYTHSWERLFCFIAGSKGYSIKGI